ncbi:hypothetical protein MA16_Dca023052 [Dendrobium catenatum]|uniref:Uncharacterized protein n=1 Tax=Dendrobium catenatum TaxID=906689 RepID=A0A2I0VHM9_9ASPA|nr:hypothetical protein MA16_Dca023052 [Dendrobium catenatum]
MSFQKQAFDLARKMSYGHSMTFRVMWRSGFGAWTSLFSFSINLPNSSFLFSSPRVPLLPAPYTAEAPPPLSRRPFSSPRPPLTLEADTRRYFFFDLLLVF